MMLMVMDDVFVPTHHLFWHLLARMRKQGNPTWYSTWQDEANNRILKESCRLTSQLTFDSSVLLRMRDILENRKRKI